MKLDGSRDWNNATERFFQKLVRISFSKRRKTLFNCLKPLLSSPGISLDAVRNQAREVEIDLQRRAETLSVREFYRLADIILKYH